MGALIAIIALIAINMWTHINENCCYYMLLILLMLLMQFLSIIAIIAVIIIIAIIAINSINANHPLARNHCHCMRIPIATIIVREHC